MKHSSMMGTTTTFSFLFFLLFISSAFGAQFKTVGYLTNWGNIATDAGKIDYSIITHVNIAFINPSNSGTLSPTTNLSTAVQTIHNNNAKVLASLGGAGATSAWATLMEAANRDAFITKIVTFTKTWNLDGIDMDLEGSAIDGNYNDFVQALSVELKKENKLLTAAVATWNGWDIYDATLALFDFVNIMSYDQYGTWTGPGPHSTYEAAEDDLYYWGVTRGLPKSKLVLGLPNYGYRWETGGNSSMTIKQIVGSYSRAIDQDSINTTTNGVIYYNGIPTIKKKTELAIDKASGTMWWTLQFDYPTTDSRSLIGAMNEVLTEKISVQNVENAGFSLYPNPANDFLIFNMDNEKLVVLAFYDISGKKILEYTLSQNQPVDISMLPQGIFTCMISSDEKISAMKLVKQ
ncbi:MAG: glycosyl hydrolase family 18 protein [Flavobacteriales bacterium]